MDGASQDVLGVMYQLVGGVEPPAWYVKNALLEFVLVDGVEFLPGWEATLPVVE